MNLPEKLQHLVLQEINRASYPSINPLLKINAVLGTTTGKNLDCKQLMKGTDRKNWINGRSKEFARLAQVHKRDNNKGTNTLFFVHPNKSPKNNKPTYPCICANFRPQKEDPYRVQFTVGGKIIN